MLGVIEQWYGDWFAELDVDVGAEPVVASEMQAHGLNHGLGQPALVCDAGGVEGESEGTGPECVQFGVLM